jgi:hypothetical protein
MEGVISLEDFRPDIVSQVYELTTPEGQGTVSGVPED